MSERDALGLSGYVDGIDVSAVQTIADAEAVARAGFRFAFVKASEGLTGRCKMHAAMDAAHRARVAKRDPSEAA